MTYQQALEWMKKGKKAEHGYTYRLVNGQIERLNGWWQPAVLDEFLVTSNSWHLKD